MTWEAGVAGPPIQRRLQRAPRRTQRCRFDASAAASHWGLVRPWAFRLVLVFASLGSACRRESTGEDLPPSPSGGVTLSSLDAALGLGESEPSPREGMVWIAGGALVAGTAPDAAPRIAHQEMAGEQIILKGFYIDVYQYPNEEGGIPLTNVDLATARGLCEEQQKRLCTELEWERACKGPSNFMYEYGDVYDPERCGTGQTARLMPAGLRMGCQSGFGVRDMHGGAWEWTESKWQRDHRRDRSTIRGGNGRMGDVIGRCANSASRREETKASDLGFRCCAGKRNEAQVSIVVTGTPGLEGNTSVDAESVLQALEGMPEVERLQLGEPEAFRATRSWRWQPIPNEELLAFGGCSGELTGQRCGLVVARNLLGKVAFVAWASSGEWLPSLHADYNAKDVWLTGGTKAGSFKRLLRYGYGRVQVGPREKATLRPPKKKRAKSKKKSTKG